MRQRKRRVALITAAVGVAAVAMLGNSAPGGAVAAAPATTGSVLAPTPGDQRNPAVASDGSGFLVAWEDYRDGFDSHLYAARVDANGSTLDPDGIPISTELFSEGLPSVAF